MTIGTSPIGPKQPLSFGGAIQRILKGERVTRLEWDGDEFYGFLNNGLLSLHKPDGKNYHWVLSEGDMIGTDYIVI